MDTTEKLAIDQAYETDTVIQGLAAWQLDSYPDGYGADVSQLMLAEKKVPVAVEQDFSVRPKVIDACGLTCTFCHNEGTPVAVDSDGTSVSIRTTGRMSGRVSVFAATNGVDFLPGRMEPDQKFRDALAILQDKLGLHEMHLTGGEPSLHPKLASLIEAARDSGYGVRMTSNGERGAANMNSYAAAGLEKINFSIFGTTPLELAAVQHEKFQDAIMAAKKLDALHSAIQAALDTGIEAHGNIVMSDRTHADRILRVIEEFESRLVVRILPDLDRGSESYYAIYELLASLGAHPIETRVEAGSSNARVKYRLPTGRELFFKQIRPTRIDSCNDCRLNNPNDCKEGYYGARLYVDKEGEYKVGVCIQRMDLTMSIEDFAASSLASEVRELREREYNELQKLGKAHNEQHGI